MENELGVGSRIDHYKYGEGIISSVTLTEYEVFFARGGKMQFSKSNQDLVVTELVENADDSPKLSIQDIESVFQHFLEKAGVTTDNVAFSDKWMGGTILLKPKDTSLKPHEIPIESLFHKIVMIRDRLRVMEQTINSHPKLNDEDRINLQQYITRIYGSLTSFNILFKNKSDHFVGSGKHE